MIVEEALVEVLNHVSTLEAEEKPLLSALGQVVAEDVRSPYGLPMLDMCGPDGYAVRSEDIRRANPENPAVLKIAGRVRAGQVPRHHVGPGEAMRVMTGSPVPDGADCIVPFENTDEPAGKNGPSCDEPSYVKIYRAEKSRANIRPAGNNVAKGALVLPRGSSIGPAQISALATIGRSTVKVIRRPRVAVISTGDELISLKSPLRPAKSYDCNGAALASLVGHYGGIPQMLGIARDKEGSLEAKLRSGMGADAIITSGGVSKGDYDLVRLVLGKMGRVVLSRISMGPGASFAFGLVDRGEGGGSVAAVPVFGLSGPPIGCLTNFETLVRPALLKMLGFGELEHRALDAVVEDSVWGKKPMAFVKWAHLDRSGGRVTLNGSDKLGPLGAMATANCLAIIPPETVVKQGDVIEVLPLDWTRD